MYNNACTAQIYYNTTRVGGIVKVINDKNVNINEEEMALALFSSGNHAISLCDRLNSNGIYAEVIQTPCRIAPDGCSLCILFKLSDMCKINDEGRKYGTLVRIAYKIIKTDSRDKYEKVTW